MALAFIVDNQTDKALSLCESDATAEQTRSRLGDQKRFTVELYCPGGDKMTAARIRQIGGKLAAYTFG